MGVPTANGPGVGGGALLADLVGDIERHANRVGNDDGYGA
jgi:hypothetical protein